MARWSRLVSGAETVESRLKDVLPEFLNAEIALRTVADVGAAAQWAASTFFYVRVRCRLSCTAGIAP